MKTTSHTRGRRRFILDPRVLGVVFLCAVLFFAAALWRELAGGLLWRALAPVVAVRNALSASQNARLQARLTSTEALIADRAMLYRENQDLKARLGRNAGREVLLASILLRPPGIPYDTLMIDVGSAQGVGVGDLISAGGSTIIGRVSQVYEGTARVVLFSAPGETHEALLSLQNGDIMPIVLEGQGGGSFFAKVPAGTLAAVGDAVVIPGITSGLFAAVSAIEAPEGESFKTLHFHLPANPFALQYVEVWVVPTL